jgi:MFS transporter, FSR family, fosmidomycin resistance protein
MPDDSSTAASQTRSPRLPLGRLATVIFAHGVIDWLSAIVIPILSYLEGRVEMTPTQGATLIAVGSIASGLIQPMVALISDKHDTRWAGTAGLIAAVLAIGCLGFAQNFTHLLLIQIIGTAGIGAFHPVGAAAAGQLAGRARSGAISIFYATGLAGGVSGSFASPQIAEHLGLKSLVWTIPPVLLFALVLAWAIHKVPHRQAGALDHHNSLPQAERRRRWCDVSLLYIGNVFRFVANMMLVVLLVRWCETQILMETKAASLNADLRLEASILNGPLQAMMALGMGISGLAVGWFVSVERAKWFLFGMPLVGVVVVAAFPWLPRMGVHVEMVHGGIQGKAAVWFVAALMGMGYSAVMPLTITMAQRLLPHRTSLASALMMGGAWSVAFVGPPAAQWMLKVGLSMEQCFGVVAGLLFLSSLLALPMGKTPEDRR